jgi:glycosyltransferase involved in cell wall biosynthesis
LKTKKIKLLFITEATITGAPILLLNVLKVLRSCPEIEMKILVKRHGELVPEFKKISKVFVTKGKLYLKKNANFFYRASRFIGSICQRIISYPAFLSTDVIVSNTITNGNLISELSFLRAPVICYVHELENVIKAWKSKDDIQNSLEASDLFIVPSEHVKQNLVQNHLVDASKIKLFRTFLPLPEIENFEKEKSAAKKKFCKLHGLEEGTFLVAGMGTADERKGIDLFVETAAHISKINENVCFVWMGPFADREVERNMLDRVSNWALQKQILFTGSLPYSPLNLLPFDLFFLSSREDPYPLVVLEAASLHIPAICFERSGGIVDFVQDECGWIIKDHNIGAASGLINLVSADHELVNQYGNNAYEKFKREHNNEVNVKEQFLQFLNLVLQK